MKFDSDIPNLKFSSDSAKFLKKQDKKTVSKIIEKLKTLAENPTSNYRLIEAEKLEGIKEMYKFRVGKIRVLYSLVDNNVVVYVVKVDYRGDVYK